MRVKRGQLSFTALAFACMLAAVPAIPASADEPGTVTAKVKTQSLTVAASDTTPDIERGAFKMSTYSDVQAPIPMSTPVSSPFGFRIPPCAGCSSYHEGVDLTPGVGYKIEAIADGVVTDVGNPSGGLGVYIVIEHQIEGKVVSSVYAHMALGSMHYQIGDKISRGDIVGAVGSTGQSTGPHLYFAIRLGGTRAIEPMAWLKDHINTKS